MKKNTLVALAIAATLAGCATPHVVETTKLSDKQLSCSQIELEMREADRFRTDAQKEMGMTGTNVAAAIFFWPAMIGTYSNSKEAMAAADTRKSNLTSLAMKKNCDGGGGIATGGTDSEHMTAIRLKSLKGMLDQGLITKPEFDVRRAKIVAEM